MSQVKTVSSSKVVWHRIMPLGLSALSGSGRRDTVYVWPPRLRLPTLFRSDMITLQLSLLHHFAREQTIFECAHSCFVTSLLQNHAYSSIALREWGGGVEAQIHFGTFRFRVRRAGDGSDERDRRIWTGGSEATGGSDPAAGL